jgi:hypothetical protein
MLSDMLHRDHTKAAPASPIATQETVDRIMADFGMGLPVDQRIDLRAAIREALSSAERRNEELVRAHEARLLEIGNERQDDGNKYLAALRAYRMERERATKAEATIASLTGTVGELMRERAAKVADEQAEKLRGVMDLADTGGFDVCALVFKACAKAADDIAATIRALEPSPPGISTTGGDGEAAIVLDEARLKRAAEALIAEAGAIRTEVGMGPISTSVGGISAGNYRLLRAAIRAALPELFPRPPGEPEA